MNSTLQRRLLLVACFVIMSAAPRRAAADLSIRLDDPNQEITLPPSGDVVVVFTGMATGGTPNGTWETRAQLSGPYNVEAGMSGQRFDASGNIADGSILVRVDFGQSDQITPGTFTGGFTLLDDSTQESAVDDNISITFVASPLTAVPEPSTAIVAVFGAVGFIAYGRARHGRKHHHQGVADRSQPDQRTRDDFQGTLG